MIKKVLILFLFIIIFKDKIEKFDIISKQLKPFGYYLHPKGYYNKKINKKDTAELILDEIL